MSAKSDKIAELDAAYDRFRSLIADLPGDAFSEVWLGDWDLDRLLAHFAGWFREITPAFARVSAGMRPVAEGVSYDDTEGWNASFVANAPHGKDALHEFDHAFEAYRDAAHSTPEDLFGMDPAKGRPRIGDRLVENAGINHFAEHQEEVESWLKSRSS
ncbi:MAG: maleylpyruvate isomerase N-terminal domain-containing protein [Dehalococcoidia bacterium]|nr:maleylpyruvate isomerase N-terminal domain-containing protein [Dehalococcoidia bacterium]